MERWRDEMNWARQGKAGEKSQKGEKGKEKKARGQLFSLPAYTLSRALKLFFFWFFSLHFFLGLDDHDPSSSSFPAKITPRPKG